MLWTAIIALIAIVAVVALRRSGDQRVSMPVAGGAEAESVERLVAEGRKIDAIKLYRQQHGVGLREAKDAVDQMELSGPSPISY